MAWSPQWLSRGSLSFPRVGSPSVQSSCSRDIPSEQYQLFLHPAWCSAHKHSSPFSHRALVSTQPERPRQGGSVWLIVHQATTQPPQRQHLRRADRPHKLQVYFERRDQEKEKCFPQPAGLRWDLQLYSLSLPQIAATREGTLLVGVDTRATRGETKGTSHKYQQGSWDCPWDCPRLLCFEESPKTIPGLHKITQWKNDLLYKEKAYKM